MTNTILAVFIAVGYFIAYLFGKEREKSRVEKKRNDELSRGLQIKQYLHSRNFDSRGDANNRDNAK